MWAVRLSGGCWGYKTHNYYYNEWYTITNQHAGMYSSPHLAKKPGPKLSAASSGRLQNKIYTIIIIPQ